MVYGVQSSPVSWRQSDLKFPLRADDCKNYVYIVYALCIVYCVLCIVYNVYIVLCIVYIVLCIVYIVYCA